MLPIHKKQGHLFVIGIVFVLIKSYYTQTTVQTFFSSDVELVPSIAILNSTSVGNFLCINHQSDDEPVIISLSKNISNDQLKIFLNQLNTTTMNIRIQLRDYIGIFHLFCDLKGKSNQRTVADVIVKSKTGLIQLIERCHVYDRQYIKCIIRAPNIARAIQNDFPDEFEFSENTDLRAYETQHEFLKNESTDEYLVFKWKPSVDGEFPNGVIMDMKIRLPYFGTSYYRFDMTPIFLTKPNVDLKELSNNQIQIGLTSMLICERNINQTWKMIESGQNVTIIDNLLSNITYELCIRCRQTRNSSYSIEECRQIRTSDKFDIGSIMKIVIPIVIISCLIIIIISGLIYSRFYNNKPKTEEVPGDDDASLHENPLLRIENHDLLPVIEPMDDTHPDLPNAREYLPLSGLRQFDGFSIGSGRSDT